MSKLVKCRNGHYYDPQKYSSCPHCANIGSAVANEMTEAISNIPQGGDVSRTLSGTSNNVPPSTVLTGDDPLDKTIGVAVWNGNQHEGEGLNKLVEPVVGWLVCIKGSEFGKSFTLRAGRNFIGRDDSNNVSIKGDQRISRKEHGILVYDPKGKKYHAQPGNTNELYYVNGDAVLQVRELNDRDILLLGETQMIFVAFCGEECSWDDYSE